MLSNVFALDRETGRRELERALRATERPVRTGPPRVRADLRRYRHDGVRPRRRKRATAVAAPHPHPRSSTSSTSPPWWRTASSTRARSAFPQKARERFYALDARNRPDALEVRDDRERRGATPARRRGRSLVPGLRRRSRAVCYSGISNPGPWGGTASSRTAASPGRRAGRTRCSSLTATAAAALGRPGDAARCPRLRLPGLADPRRGGRPQAGVRSGQGRSRDRLGPETRRRIWERKVGVHVNDEGLLPRTMTTVCPGPVRGSRDADGLRGRPPLRSRRRPLRPRERERLRAARAYRRFRPGHREARRARRRDRPACSGSGASPTRVFSCATVANDVVFTATFDGCGLRPSCEGRTDALEGADACRHQLMPCCRRRPPRDRRGNASPRLRAADA